MSVTALVLTLMSCTLTLFSVASKLVVVPLKIRLVSLVMKSPAVPLSVVMAVMMSRALFSAQVEQCFILMS